MSLPVNKVSTADLVASARAWHMRHPTPIFEDPYAKELCGPVLGFALRFRPFEWLLFKVALAAVMPASMCVVMRARYAEQALERAVEEGIRQYVIIGAGMDSFAFRRPDLLEEIDAFEIDHPVTQRKKLDRIAKAGFKVPKNHHFVAADLSQVSTVEALATSAFDMSKPTFLSLLGVIYYLTPETLVETVGSIAQGLPPGTRLVFDYLLDEESCVPAGRPLRARMLKFVKGRGEPMRSSYSLAQMNALMAREGFKPVESFEITDLEDGYRVEFGELPIEIPGIFGFGTFEVAGKSD